MTSGVGETAGGGRGGEEGEVLDDDGGARALWWPPGRSRGALSEGTVPRRDRCHVPSSDQALGRALTQAVPLPHSGPRVREMVFIPPRGRHPRTVLRVGQVEVCEVQIFAQGQPAGREGAVTHGSVWFGASGPSTPPPQSSRELGPGLASASVQ